MGEGAESVIPSPNVCPPTLRGTYIDIRVANTPCLTLVTGARALADIHTRAATFLNTQEGRNSVCVYSWGPVLVQ